MVGYNKVRKRRGPDCTCRKKSSRLPAFYDEFFFFFSFCRWRTGSTAVMGNSVVWCACVRGDVLVTLRHLASTSEPLVAPMHHCSKPHVQLRSGTHRAVFVFLRQLFPMSVLFYIRFDGASFSRKKKNSARRSLSRTSSTAAQSLSIVVIGLFRGLCTTLE